MYMIKPNLLIKGKRIH